MTLWTPEIGLLLALALPLLGAVGVVALGRRPDLREAATLAAAVLLLLNILPLVLAVGAGARPELFIARLAPGLDIALRLEPLGALFALTASALWLVNAVFSIGYMRANGERDQTRFYAFFALAIAAAMGVALSANMLTLFVFYEALTLTTYPLVAHRGDDASRSGARIYLLFLLGTSLALLLPAVVATYAIAGSTEFTPGGLLAATGAGAGAIGVLLVLYVFGTAKAALMPVHVWLPRAMVAPTPVSALLHAVAVVKAGVFTVLKISVYLFGPAVVATSPAAHALAVLAAISIVLAALIAMRKDNLKARLAWSTVSQLGCVTLGAMLATPAALAGAAVQIVMHAFAKITLFMCAGAFTTATGLKNASDTRGFGRRMPALFAAFAVAAASIAALPLTGGMWAKLFLSQGAAQADAIWAILALALSSLLGVAYLLAIPVRAFFASGPKADVAHPAPSRLLVWPPLAGAACVVILFFLAGPIHDYVAPAFETEPFGAAP